MHDRRAREESGRVALVRETVTMFDGLTPASMVEALTEPSLTEKLEILFRRTRSSVERHLRGRVEVEHFEALRGAEKRKLRVG